MKRFLRAENGYSSFTRLGVRNASNVPDQILNAFVAKLRLYGFWGGEGVFTELVRILEKMGERFAQAHNARCAMEPDLV